MDPNATLAELRKLVAKRFDENGYAEDDGDGEHDDHNELAQHVQALDEWLTKGGFVPDAWKPQDKPAPGVHRYLDLSTSHLTQGEMNGVRSDHPSVPRSIRHEHGAWVHVPQDNFDDVGTERDRRDYPNVWAVLDYARTLGNDVYWVNFDSDGDVVSNLPTYEW